MMIWLRTNPTPDSAVFCKMPDGTSASLRRVPSTNSRIVATVAKHVDRRGLVEAERAGAPDRDVADRRYVDREQEGVHWSPEGRAGFNPGAASVRLTYFISQTSNPSGCRR